MYNRYIPQPDGTYRRNRVQEPPRPNPRPPEKPHTPPPEHTNPEAPKPAPCPAPQRPCGIRQPNRSAPPKQESHTEQSVTGFLRRLLPKDFDTGDLLIVLLLLLMAGDSCDDQNNALLTLALYFLM